MQDKPNIEIDGQFVDSAWEEMQKMLDAEMPVQQKGRRKPLLWLWLLLGLVATGVGAGWYLPLHGSAF